MWVPLHQPVSSPPAFPADPPIALDAAGRKVTPLSSVDPSVSLHVRLFRVVCKSLSYVSVEECGWGSTSKRPIESGVSLEGSGKTCRESNMVVMDSWTVSVSENRVLSGRTTDCGSSLVFLQCNYFLTGRCVTDVKFLCRVRLHSSSVDSHLLFVVTYLTFAGGTGRTPIREG